MQPTCRIRIHDLLVEEREQEPGESQIQPTPSADSLDSMSKSISDRKEIYEPFSGRKIAARFSKLTHKLKRHLCCTRRTSARPASIWRQKEELIEQCVNRRSRNRSVYKCRSSSRLFDMPGQEIRKICDSYRRTPKKGDLWTQPAHEVLEPPQQASTGARVFHLVAYRCLHTTVI